MADERSLNNNNTNKQNIDVIAYKLDQLGIDVKDIKIKLDSNYATKEWCESQYGQTRKQLTWILMTFGGAIILAFATFIIKGGLI